MVLHAYLGDKQQTRWVRSSQMQSHPIDMVMIIVVVVIIMVL
jgi:hypothetical protein